jgi:uncharacterized membrane protein
MMVDWYKFLANTEVPWRQWTKARWTYNLVDYGLWLIGVALATNVAYLTYTIAPVYDIFVGLIQLIGIAALAAILQSYNDNRLVPKGV